MEIDRLNEFIQYKQFFKITISMSMDDKQWFQGITISGVWNKNEGQTENCKLPHYWPNNSKRLM